MKVHRAGAALSLAAKGAKAALPMALAAAGALSAVHYRAMPRVAARPGAGDGHGAGAPDAEAGWPRVSIIVPARDEERTLPALLASLAALDYPDYEVIVVDDASTDGTGAVGRVFAASDSNRFRGVCGAGPASGWTGKTYACALGAAEATGEWLLFTDADTIHAPASLRASVSAARAAQVRALSLFTQQRCHTFWERLLLPFAYQQYFVGARPARRSHAGGQALANGQYLLIARAAYDAAGGHAAVAASLIDDVALAAALARAGHPALACRGETLVAVHMYAGLRPLIAGFTKNSAQFVRAQRLNGALVVGSTACAASVLPGALVALRTRRLGALALAVAAYGIQAAGLAVWERRFGVPRGYALLTPVAALAFTGIALSSAYHALANRPVRWKSRAYPVVATRECLEAGYA